MLSHGPVCMVIVLLLDILGVVFHICIHWPLIGFRLAIRGLGRRHVRQTLPLWRLESLVCELARVPPSAGICCLGTLNSICLFIFHFTSATIDRTCYLGTLNSICLFSFHSASATIGRICYLGTPNGICLFSFHFASCISHR